MIFHHSRLEPGSRHELGGAEYKSWSEIEEYKDNSIHCMKSFGMYHDLFTVELNLPLVN